MKKLVLALTAVAAMTVSASAADLAARPYSKAPMMAAPIYNWTGFYIFGGGGYGLMDSDDQTIDVATGTPDQIRMHQGGHGYFGTVGAGYDWQFGGSWVAGVFADGQFGSIKGTIYDANQESAGSYKLRTSAAAGVRVGYLIAPTVLSYINGGYSYADFSGSTLSDINFGGPDSFTNGFHRNGWFLGGGVENQINAFGLSPGWFMKTEYRVAEYERGSVPSYSLFTGLPLGSAVSTKPIVQTIGTSLVYRFNWGGPIVARY